jgi:hypothetical protein
LSRSTKTSELSWRSLRTNAFEQAAVFGEPLVGGVLGSGHVARDRYVSPSCEAEWIGHTEQRKLWTMVQSQRKTA